jgi:hypothetical protein
MMEGAVNGFDNTNVMLWKLGPADKNTGTYIATTDFPYVHEMDPDTLAVKHKWGLNELTDGISLGSCSHWRREVGKDSSIQYHMIYNPLTLRPDFVLYRFGNTWQVSSHAAYQVSERFYLFILTRREKLWANSPCITIP